MLNQATYQNYGIHKNKIISFKEGINIIIGDNRKGKTTFLEGICFANWGKTKNSKIKNVINFSNNKTKVKIDSDYGIFNRERTETQSKLGGITKIELEKKLNLSYQEFLHLFYISSKESNQLLEASYFRNFLINLFDLKKYTILYNNLYQEHKGLKNYINKQYKINKQLYKQRFNKLTEHLKKYKSYIQKIEQTFNILNNRLQEINENIWKINYQMGEINKKRKFLALNKCPKCKRVMTKDYKIEEEKKLNSKLEIIEVKKEKYIKEKNKIEKRVNEVNKKEEIISEKITKIKNLLYKIKDRIKQSEKVDDKRLKEIEQLLPIFSSKGFPAYLIKIYIPAIQATANNLLNIMFNGLFIEIRTEKPGSNISDFKVLVKNKDKVVELDDCSGSEAVLINLCLRLGVVVLYKKLKQTCIDYFFVDEAVDVLDDNNCHKLIDLFNNTLKVGLIKQVVIVSHKNSLKNVNNVNYIKI